GKTTITRLVQALYWIDSGAILVDGTDIRDIDLAHLRNNIGVVLQESFLFSGTIRDNIRMGRADATFEDVIAAAKLAGADDFVSQLPHRYDTELEEGARNLSGGERQRLAIARALIRNPKILIFDEATSALDPESEYLIRKNLSKMARGRTLIAISHRLSMVRDADMLLVVENGRVTATGPHDVLLKKSPTYKRLWEQQMGSAK
ncbi:MAG: ATP-binding cassette domain-containing protein, partial [Microthrixaceae bacterium]|nr:ATP-binding cassette domain-containing protein [Microthrixaceae bacterium]